MTKLSKKLILFCVLILDLCKQMVVGLSIFLYNRTLGTRLGAFISIGTVALAFLFAMFVWAPSEMMADVSEAKKTNNPVSTKQKISEVKDNQLKDIDSLLASNVEGKESGRDSGLFTGLGAINFQATEYNAGAIGRSEPFAPRNFGSSGMPGPPGASPLDMDPSSMSAEELAAQEAEKRRNEIKSTIGSDITIKGIIFDEDGSDPMAIIEYVAENGDVKVKTVVPGDVLNLSICEATIVEIAKNTIDVKSEDVVKRKYLPTFEDEADDSALVSEESGDIDESGENLMPPPVPTGGDTTQGNDSSMSDAKKKIEEIDKLLDSF